MLMSVVFPKIDNIYIYVYIYLIFSEEGQYYWLDRIGLLESTKFISFIILII